MPQKKVAWTWEPDQKQAFDQVESALTSDRALAHYDPSKTLILACDATPDVMSAVLSHQLEDGPEKPVAFASRSLAPAEKYSQLDKEGLAIVFGVKRFHQYLVEHHFTTLSDHKPLQQLYGETCGVPTLVSVCIQLWALTFGGYGYSIQYKSEAHHANSGALSHLPLPESAPHVPAPGENLLALSMLECLPVTPKEIRKWIDRDPVPAKVHLLLQNGWKGTSEEDLKPYQQRHTELSLQDGCILWGARVVIRPPGQDRILAQLHEGHPGIFLARSFVWWPRLNKALEGKVECCKQCQHSQHLSAVSPTLQWDWLGLPLSHLYVDYAGPLLRHIFGASGCTLNMDGYEACEGSYLSIHQVLLKHCLSKLYAKTREIIAAEVKSAEFLAATTDVVCLT